MTNERWNRLKEVTWFSTEQEEVIKYVDSLRGKTRTPGLGIGEREALNRYFPKVNLVDELLVINKKLRGFWTG